MVKSLYIAKNQVPTLENMMKRRRVGKKDGQSFASLIGEAIEALAEKDAREAREAAA